MFVLLNFISFHGIHSSVVVFVIGVIFCRPTVLLTAKRSQVADVHVKISNEKEINLTSYVFDKQFKGSVKTHEQRTFMLSCSTYFLIVIRTYHMMVDADDDGMVW